MTRREHAPSRRTVLAAGAALALPGGGLAAGAEIAVGQIGPFTGMPAPDASQLHSGIQAALAELDAAGGIGGRRIALFELDDHYDDDAFMRQFAEAARRRPAALLSLLGTRQIQRMLDDRLLDRDDLLVLGAVPGAEGLRNPGHPRLFHVRAGDRQQVEHIIRHAVTLTSARVAALVQDVPIGRSGLSAAIETAGLLGVKLEAMTVASGGDGLSEAARRAAVGQARSALVLGAPRFVAEAVAALRRAGYAGFLYALGYVPPALVRQVAGDAAHGLALAQVCPDPNGATMALQSAFQSAMRRAGYAAPYEAFHLEGYITARVLFEGLRHAREATPAALARGLHAMGEVDLGGWRIDFSRGNVGSSFVDLAAIGGNGQLVY